MKVKALNWFLCIICAVLFFSFAYTVQYDLNRKTLQKESNSFYSENAMFFTASKEVGHFQELYQVLPPSSVFYAVLPSGNWLDIRGFAVKGGTESPPMSAGRFFSASDFPSGEKRAVVGSHADLLEMGETSYFQYREDLYEVIGVIGYSFPSKLDDMVLLSLNDEQLSDAMRFVVDSSNLQNNADFLGQESIFGEVTLFDPDAFDISKVIDRNKIQKITTLLLAAVLLLNVLLFLYFWVDAKFGVYSVKKANGYTSRQLVLQTAAEVLLCCIPAAAIAALALVILYTATPAAIAAGAGAGTFIVVPFAAFASLLKLREADRQKLGVSN